MTTDLKDKTVEKLRPHSLCVPGCEGRCIICPSDAWDELVARLTEAKYQIAQQQLIIDEYEKLIADLQKDTW